MPSRRRSVYGGETAFYTDPKTLPCGIPGGGKNLLGVHAQPLAHGTVRLLGLFPQARDFSLSSDQGRRGTDPPDAGRGRSFLQSPAAARPFRSERFLRSLPPRPRRVLPASRPPVSNRGLGCWLGGRCATA